jgi:hypothetical protein
MYTAQLVCQGICKQVEIIRAFSISKNSISRSVKKYLEKGPEAFFAPRKGNLGSILTDEIKYHAQELFNLGRSKKEVTEELGIKYDTLRKAVNQGRLSVPKQALRSEASDKSTRTVEDASAEMGVGCTRPVERVAAALGILHGAPTRFEASRDVTFGGVLCALPALVAGGLFRYMDECFKTLNGYYTNVQVFILLAYMALCRIETVEKLQQQPPGELGKLMGLDRIPEVRCLRSKLAALSENDAPEKWSRLLSRDWMESSPELAGALYVDGHVRVYHGKKTILPRKFVSRERLCLRGTTDYWVNDALGQPYFVISRTVDQGMLEALKSDIIPRLLKDVPGQPSEKELQDEPYRHRFIVIFDREGYSPVFFKDVWKKYRIACITYHKFPKDSWPEEWFVNTVIDMPNGEKLTIKLAEMGSWIGDKKNGLWVREVRKLCKSGHQTSLISTARSDAAPRNAALIFSRWSQENFFGYMMKHYAIDLLSEYGTEVFPGKQQVVNPTWRELNRQCRSLKSKLTHRRAKYAEMVLHSETKNRNVAKWRIQKADLVEEIEQIEHNLEQLKIQLQKTPGHIDWHDLEQEQKFEKLKPSRKHLTDTIKMSAYRAETAMVNIVREKLARWDDARALIVNLCKTEADILPDPKAGVLTIQIHNMANLRSNQAIEHLLQNLNDTSFNYPGTNMRLHYRMASSSFSQP